MLGPRGTTSRELDILVSAAPAPMHPGSQWQGSSRLAAPCAFTATVAAVTAAGSVPQRATFGPYACNLLLHHGYSLSRLNCSVGKGPGSRYGLQGMMIIISSSR
jgi:hypothetical protein